MKKFLSVVTLLITLFCAVALTACSGKDKTPDEITSNYENLADGGKFVINSGSGAGEAVFDFGKQVAINTVVLREKGSNITSFEIYADDGEEPVYGNDYIDGYRYCAFGTISVTKIRIKVNSCDGAWELNDIEAYNISKKEEGFEVMSYIYADTACLLTDAQAELAKKITQFNLFGCTYFDPYGKIFFKEYTIDGKSCSGEEVLRKAVENLRKANPAATLVITVLAGGGTSVAETHNSAMGDNSETLTSSLIKLIEDFGLDGVSFDYEYPEKLKDFNTYSKYIKKLDSALPQGKLITAAISDWCIRLGGFSAKDLEPLDAIELMAYDSFDERGNHSTFYNSCYTILKNMEKKGVDMSKVNLGLPFYSRPVNKDAFWGAYSNVAEKLSPYENTVIETYVNTSGTQCPATANYYNGRQMVYDKTRYAIDSGAGGVMIWYFGADSEIPEYSLFYQIDAAVNGEYII